MSKNLSNREWVGVLRDMAKNARDRGEFESAADTELQADSLERSLKQLADRKNSR